MPVTRATYRVQLNASFSLDRLLDAQPDVAVAVDAAVAATNADDVQGGAAAMSEVLGRFPVAVLERGR